MYLLNLISTWKPVIEILILWFVIYQIILFFEGSRAIQVLRGLIVLVTAFFLFQKLNLEVLDWLFTKLFGISVIIIIFVFQPEIRQGLARLGQRNMFGRVLREEGLDDILKQIGHAVDNLAKDRVGVLIAVERNDALNEYAQTGVVIDANVSSELIEAVFTRNSILHDGGMIIQNGRISAAGCLFPLTENQDLNRIFGTRHRAALGLSEETDALIIVISEERQDVSLVYNGKMYRDLGREEMLSKIKDILQEA